MPVNIPISTAAPGPRLKAIALPAPVTANSPNPKASKICTGLFILAMSGNQKNVTAPAMTDRVIYRQSWMEAGGTAPMSTSRVIPPGGGCHEGQYEHSEQIDSVLHAGDGAAEREGEGPDEVEHSQELADQDFVIDLHTWRCANERPVTSMVAAGGSLPTSVSLHFCTNDRPEGVKPLPFESRRHQHVSAVKSHSDGVTSFNWFAIVLRSSAVTASAQRAADLRLTRSYHLGSRALEFDLHLHQVVEGLSPPSCRTCSAHQKNAQDQNDLGRRIPPTLWINSAKSRGLDPTV